MLLYCRCWTNCKNVNRNLCSVPPWHQPSLTGPLPISQTSKPFPQWMPHLVSLGWQIVGQPRIFRWVFPGNSLLPGQWLCSHCARLEPELRQVRPRSNQVRNLDQVRLQHGKPEIHPHRSSCQLCHISQQGRQLILCFPWMTASRGTIELPVKMNKAEPSSRKWRTQNVLRPTLRTSNTNFTLKTMCVSSERIQTGTFYPLPSERTRGQHYPGGPREVCLSSGLRRPSLCLRNGLISPARWLFWRC